MQNSVCAAKYYVHITCTAESQELIIRPHQSSQCRHINFAATVVQMS